MYEGGIADMNYSISNNAEYSEYVTGSEVINEQSRSDAQCPKRIQSGEYAKMFIAEGAANYPSWLLVVVTTPIINRKTGAKLRAMMPWIGGNKIIDKEKN